MNELFPTDNPYGIPCLLKQNNISSITAPVIQWGEVPRTNRYAGGTIAFYVDDYRFSRIETEPDCVFNAGFKIAVEPNYSIGYDTPFAVAMWAVYRKRWLARYWQGQGLSILVDVNVADAYSQLNLLGVPDGWQAYATRGSNARLESLETEYETAWAKAGRKPDLFVVYAGGKAVESWAIQHEAIYIMDRLTAARRAV